MTTRYERYNEITFDAYCKTSIRNAVRKAGKDKQARARREVPLSGITEEALYAACPGQALPAPEVRDIVTFHISGKAVPVADWELGQALARLTPRMRNILLMSYVWGMSDVEIAKALDTPKSTVWRRRTASVRRLRDFLGDRG